jgi:hypothetical protein
MSMRICGAVALHIGNAHDRDQRHQLPRCSRHSPIIGALKNLRPATDHAARNISEKIASPDSSAETARVVQAPGPAAEQAGILQDGT